MTLPAGIRVAWREVPVDSARRDVSRALLDDLVPGARFRSRCLACGGDHGRIHVEGADAAVSVSYVKGWTVAVAAWGHERVGVDAVPVDAGGLERVLPQFVPLRPAAFESSASGALADARGASAAPARAWARVEAVLKADGRGLTVDARCVDVTSDGAAWFAQVRSPSRGEARMTDEGEAIDRERRWRGWDLDGPSGVAIAVAVAARAETVSG